MVQTNVSASVTTRKEKAETIQPSSHRSIAEPVSTHGNSKAYKHKGTLEMRHSFQKGTRCTHDKLEDRIPTGLLRPHTCHTSFHFCVLPPKPSPLLSQPVHGEKAFQAVTAFSAAAPKQASCISWRSMSRATWQLKKPPLPAPNPSRKVRSCHQAHATQ